MIKSKLVRLRRWLIRWIDNPWVDLVMGLFVLVTGVFEFTVEQAHQLDGAKGLVLLGGWVIAKAMLRLLESVDLMLGSANSLTSKRTPKWLKSDGFTIAIHLMIAVFLVTIGINEAVDEFNREVGNRNIWHINLAIIGFMIIIKTMGEFMEAVYFANKAAKKAMHKGAMRAIAWLRFPQTELTMAFLVLFVSLWQHLIQPGLEGGIGAHHGFAFYALIHITRFFASMSVTTDLIYLSNSESQFENSK